MIEIKGIQVTKELKEHFEEKTVEEIKSRNIETKEIAETQEYYVTTYRDLVEQLANLSHINKEYLLFFRGQKEDYKKQIVGNLLFIPLYIEGIYQKKN